MLDTRCRSTDGTVRLWDPSTGAGTEEFGVGIGLSLRTIVRYSDRLAIAADTRAEIHRSTAQPPPTGAGLMTLQSGTGCLRPPTPGTLHRPLALKASQMTNANRTFLTAERQSRPRSTTVSLDDRQTDRSRPQALLPVREPNSSKKRACVVARSPTRTAIRRFRWPGFNRRGVLPRSRTLETRPWTNSDGLDAYEAAEMPCASQPAA